MNSKFKPGQVIRMETVPDARDFVITSVSEETYSGRYLEPVKHRENVRRLTFITFQLNRKVSEALYKVIWPNESN